MPLLCGPKNSRFTFTGSRCPHLDLAVESAAKTLDEALRDYERRFNVRVTPCQAPKARDADGSLRYFDFLDLNTKSLQWVDVHVIRDGVALCAKQDLMFALQPDDIVELGELLC